MSLGLGLAGAAVLGALGLLHLVFTVRDLVGRPRYFAPRDRALLDAMQTTVAGIAPKGRDYWQALLGFHVSHSMAVLMVASVVAGGTLGGPAWLSMAGLALTALYGFLSWRFWFAVPMWGCLISAGLQIAALAIPVSS